MLTDRHIFSLTHSARLKLQQGNWIGALNIYNDILRERPDHKDTYVEIARLYLEREDVNSAREVIEKAVKIAPEDQDVQFIFGVIKYIEGDFEGAINSFRFVERHAGLDCNLAVNLAISNESLGNFREALKYMEYAISRGEPNWYAFEFIADQYRRLGEIDNAIKAVEVACTKFTQSPQPHLLLAQLYQQIGNEIAVIKHVELASLKANMSPKDLSNIARFLINTKRYRQAIPVLEKLLEIERENEEWQNLLAKCRSEVEQKDKGQETSGEIAKVMENGTFSADENTNLPGKEE